jgi:leucyl aminopeptidase
MDSKIADIKNTAMGSSNVGGSTLKGETFLKEFIGDKRWAHIDIAATAFNVADDDFITSGATGVMVRTIIEHAMK